MNIKNRFLFYSILNGILFVVFIIKSAPVWFLFLCLSIHYAYRSIRPLRITDDSVDESTISFGVLGNYCADGIGEEAIYGLYIKLNRRPVFVDISEDEFIEERKAIALDFFKNIHFLQDSLNEFMERNPDFRGRYIGCIGLHAKDLSQGEVFWEPDGYTSLKEMKFIL